MRLAGLTAALACWALACPASSATAQPPSAAGPGETLLEVDSVGIVRNRPDLVRMFVSVKSTGETAAKARAANLALAEKIRSAARAAGARPGNIVPAVRTWRLGFIGNEISDAAMPAALRTSIQTEISTLEIRLEIGDPVEDIRTAVEQAGADQVSDPTYDLKDATAARRAAKREAVNLARAEAEEYARALGMRVVRILRVSERTAPPVTPEDMESLYAAMGFGGGSPREIETRVRIGIDFALAPAR